MNFTERYRQARLFAAQVRQRKAMGDKYEHATPWRGPAGSKMRKVDGSYLHVIVSSQGARNVETTVLEQ